jgi:chorismate mutase
MPSRRRDQVPQRPASNVAPVGTLAARGAITVDVDSRDAVVTQTQLLVTTMLARNDITPDDVISVIFTTTPDLRSAFPASAARAVGFDDVPMIGAVEADVPGALERVVRVLMHIETDRGRGSIRHVFLGGARALRPDLADTPDAPETAGTADDSGPRDPA